VKTLWKLTWVEIKLFFREPTTMVFTLALPLLFLFVMGGVFGNDADPQYYRGFGPTNYYIPAYIGLVISSIGVISLPVHLTGYRERGVLKRWRASSISIWHLLGSQVLVSFFIAVIGSVLMIALGYVAYDINNPQGIGMVIGAFFLGMLSFAALGFLLGALFPTARAAQGIGMILFFVMLILGGAGPPPEVLPDAMRIIGEFLPTHWVIYALQSPWFGLGWDVEASLIVAGVFVVATGLSVRFFRWE
jgi:ABC-2 type transport system permease protein